jgi:hypothetical protein
MRAEVFMLRASDTRQKFKSRFKKKWHQQNYGTIQDSINTYFFFILLTVLKSSYGDRGAHQW